MAPASPLDEARGWFAEELRAIGHLGTERLIEAFATMPRERFAGPGPWRIHEAALAAALDDPTGQRSVRSLRRDPHAQDGSCWLHRDGWCLSRQELP